MPDEESLREKLGAAVQAHLIKRVPDAGGRVIVELDRNLIASETPCLAVQLGKMAAEYQGAGQAGTDRPLALHFEVLVDCIVDETPTEFRARSKRLSSAVRNALGRYREIAGLTVTNALFQQEIPVKFPCEAGFQGGFTDSFILSVPVIETDQDNPL